MWSFFASFNLKWKLSLHWILLIRDWGYFKQIQIQRILLLFWTHTDAFDIVDVKTINVFLCRFNCSWICSIVTLTYEINDLIMNYLVEKYVKIMDDISVRLLFIVWILWDDLCIFHKRVFRCTALDNFKVLQWIS